MWELSEFTSFRFMPHDLMGWRVTMFQSLVRYYRHSHDKKGGQMEYMLSSMLKEIF